MKVGGRAAAVAVIGLAVLASPLMAGRAEAGTHFSVGIGFGAPVYAPPVYVAPAPVYVQPAPVYVAPPAYVPAPAYSYGPPTVVLSPPAAYYPAYPQYNAAPAYTVPAYW